MTHRNRHFSGDPHASVGAWAPSTSTANFCEEDYAVTVYIAEFINTLTNLAYVYLAIRLGREPHTYGSLLQLDSMSWSLFLVGVTSFAYHATLRQTTQYCDELSMFALAVSLIHPLYSAGKAPHIRRSIAIVLVTSVTILSAYYIRSGNVLIHMVVFAALLSLVWPRTLYLIYCRPRPDHEKSDLIRRFTKAVATLVIAFIIWNLDLEECLRLRRLRHALGLPWAWLFEFHGWWHILTAMGAGEYIRLIRKLCSGKG